MPVSAIRILDPKDTRNFSRYGEDQDTQRVDKVPPLTDIQLRS